MYKVAHFHKDNVLWPIMLIGQPRQTESCKAPCLAAQSRSVTQQGPENITGVQQRFRLRARAQLLDVHIRVRHARKVNKAILLRTNNKHNNGILK